MMKYRKNEKGVALLIALGFVSLLLVIVMGFATNSLIERKVANNTTERSKGQNYSDLALKSAISAMELMMYLHKINDTYDKGLYRFDNIVSKNKENEDIPEDELDELFTKLSGAHYLAYRKNIYLYEYPASKSKNYNYNKDENGNDIAASNNVAREWENKLRRPQWQKVLGGDGELIGRFMYAVLPDYGKFYKDAGIKFDYTNDRRIGKNINEFDAAIFSDHFEYDSDFKYNHPIDWLRTKLAKDENAADNNDFKELAFTIFNIIETDNSITASGDLSQRNAKFKYGKNLYKDMVRLDNLPQTVDGLMDAVPYLKKIDSDATVRNQIAANIIEAFKATNAQSHVTSSSSDWSMAAPTYTGNRRTPYINEIEISLRNFNLGVTVESLNPDENGNPTERKYTVTPTIDIKVGVELYNPYNKDYEINANDIITQVGDLSITLCADSEIHDTETLNISDATRAVIKSGHYSYVTFEKKNISFDTYEKTISIDAIPTSLNVEVRLKEIPTGWIYGYKDDGTNYYRDYVGDLKEKYEFSNTKSMTDSVNLVDYTTTTTIKKHVCDTSTNNAKNISIQVKDARNNIKDTDWKVSYSNGDESNLGIRNTQCILGISDDKGTEDEKGYVIDYDTLPKFWKDTANLEKHTLADLAYISRGANGKTLNISSVGSKVEDTVNDVDHFKDGSANCSCGNSACSGYFGSDTSGDGGLLDQLTTLSKDEVDSNSLTDTNPQLIDINTRSVSIWRALFSNLKDENGNVILDENTVKLFAAKISKKIRDDNLFFKSRSGFIKLFNDIIDDLSDTRIANKLSSDLDPDKKKIEIKRKKELILSHVLPLCKTENFPEYIQLFIIAQSIKEREGEGTKGKYDKDVDSINYEIRKLIKLKRNKDNKLSIVSIEEFNKYQ